MDKKIYSTIAGLDIGNGYVKGAVCSNIAGETEIDISSSVAVVTMMHDIKTTGSDINDVMNDIFNHMDVTIDTPLCAETGRFLFGERGRESGMFVKEFDVTSAVSKAQQESSFILTLGCIAGKAAQDYWNVNKALPTAPIDVTISVIALALPITEFKSYRAAYASGYRDNMHQAVIHNFETDIVVNIRFENVQIIAEGAAAQYAIRSGGVTLMTELLNEARAAGQVFADITAEDLVQVKATLGIDIGEGTTNFPVFDANGKFNPDSSKTLPKGYGSVLTAALQRLQEMGFAFSNRKALQDYLNKGPLLKKDQYAKVQSVVDEEISGFVEEVAMYYGQMLSTIGLYVEIVEVYGGGANSVKSELYPLLIKKTKAVNGGTEGQVVLYVGSDVSRRLNCNGLYEYATRVAEQLKKSA